MDKKVKLRKVNPHITCKLCNGYLVEATTITECLHTFCKSCIVKYLEENNTCPTCDLLIHQSHPLNYIMYDRTMQDIVCKLVPGLVEKEQKQQETFYKRRGLPWPPGGGSCHGSASNGSAATATTLPASAAAGCGAGALRRSHVGAAEHHGGTPSAATADGEHSSSPSSLAADAVGGGHNGLSSKDADGPLPPALSAEAAAADGGGCAQASADAYHRLDEQVAVCLESEGQILQVPRRYIHCSTLTTVNHLKKFVASKIYNDAEKGKDIDILCQNELMGKDHTLKFVLVTRWRSRDMPLQLQYRPRVEI